MPAIPTVITFSGSVNCHGAERTRARAPATTIASATLPEQQLYDFAVKYIRTRLFTIPGLSVPAPFGGRQRMIVVEADPARLSAQGLAAADLVASLQTSNVIVPAGLALEITGLVRNPVQLTYAQLRALPQAHQVSNFHCVTGWSVPNVRWGGVRFHDLLALAQPLPSAKAIRFVSLEQPYNDSLSLDQALLPTTMLAYEMDGSPLSRPHGAPARVVIPAMYGYKGVKWLVRMELVAKQPEGYWEQLGYDQNAWVGRSNGY